jgi:hypothetical protein
MFLEWTVGVLLGFHAVKEPNADIAPGPPCDRRVFSGNVFRPSSNRRKSVQSVVYSPSRFVGLI